MAGIDKDLLVRIDEIRIAVVLRIVFPDESIEAFEYLDEHLSFLPGDGKGPFKGIHLRYAPVRDLSFADITPFP